QIQQWQCAASTRAFGMAAVQGQRQQAQPEQADGDLLADQLTIDQRQAQHHARPAERRQQQAADVQRAGILLVPVLDVAGRQHHAQDADGHVDEEDPAPMEIGGDEAPQRRPDHRTEQGRHGQVADGADEVLARHGAEDDDPPHRHHHRAADALDEAGRHQLRQ
ncbi:hypothetical protein KXX11_003986, partial [Aspergillus fumigatus]